MKYTIRLEKTIQENRFEPFRAEFAQEYDSEFWKYDDAVRHALEQLDRILAERNTEKNRKPEYRK